MAVEIKHIGCMTDGGKFDVHLVIDLKKIDYSDASSYPDESGQGMLQTRITRKVRKSERLQLHVSDDDIAKMDKTPSNDIRELILDGSDLTDLFHICKMYPNLIKLSLRGCTRIRDGGLSYLSALKYLKFLDCTKVTACTDGCLRYIGTLHELEELHLGCSPERLLLLDKGYGIVVDHQKLPELRDRAADCNLRDLRNLFNLTHLDLERFMSLTDRGVEALKKMPLKVLYVEQGQLLTDDGIVK